MLCSWTVGNRNCTGFLNPPPHIFAHALPIRRFASPSRL